MMLSVEKVTPLPNLKNSNKLLTQITTFDKKEDIKKLDTLLADIQEVKELEENQKKNIIDAIIAQKEYLNILYN